jgi:hypothetical protein
MMPLIYPITKMSLINKQLDLLNKHGANMLFIRMKFYHNNIHTYYHYNRQLNVYIYKKSTSYIHLKGKINIGDECGFIFIKQNVQSEYNEIIIESHTYSNLKLMFKKTCDMLNMNYKHVFYFINFVKIEIEKIYNFEKIFNIGNIDLHSINPNKYHLTYKNMQLLILFNPNETILSSSQFEHACALYEYLHCKIKIPLLLSILVKMNSSLFFFVPNDIINIIVNFL